MREVHGESESVRYGEMSGKKITHSKKLSAHSMSLFAWKDEEFSSKNKVSHVTNFLTKLLFKKEKNKKKGATKSWFCTSYISRVIRESCRA